MLENVSIIIPLAPSERNHEALLVDLEPSGAEIVISSEGSRAKSLNVGARKAKREILWFLHADTRVTHDNLKDLNGSIERDQNSLRYFNLAYDGNGLVVANAWGANWRSRTFGLPYGDQGFCLSRTLYAEIGPYPEDIPFGEDLIFLRRAKAMGVNLEALPSALTTSARKYRDEGWLKLTLYRQIQLFNLMRMKL